MADEAAPAAVAIIAADNPGAADSSTSTPADAAAVRLTVFGATGSLGAELVRQALAAGHSVSVLVRSAEKLARVLGEHDIPNCQKAQLTTIEGDALNDADVAKVMGSCGHVLFALGNTTSATENLCTDATRLVMSHLGDTKRRFIFCSGGSTAMEGDVVSFGVRFVRWWAATFMAKSHRDKENQMALLHSAEGQACEWFGVRPLQMGQPSVSQVHTGCYRLGYLPFNGMSKISFADCADAMLTMLTEDTWQHQAPIVQY